MIVVASKNINTGQIREIKINKKRVIAAIKWLFENNTLYQLHCNLSQENIDALSDDDVLDVEV